MSAASAAASKRWPAAGRVSEPAGSAPQRATAAGTGTPAAASAAASRRWPAAGRMIPPRASSVLPPPPHSCPGTRRPVCGRANGVRAADTIIVPKGTNIVPDAGGRCKESSRKQATQKMQADTPHTTHTAHTHTQPTQTNTDKHTSARITHTPAPARAGAARARCGAAAPLPA